MKTAMEFRTRSTTVMERKESYFAPMRQLAGDRQ
jgi:hypothetical protein